MEKSLRVNVNSPCVWGPSYFRLTQVTFVLQKCGNILADFFLVTYMASTPFTLYSATICMYHLLLEEFGLL